MMIALISSLSAAGGIWAENAILQNRLPMEEEYSLISACVDQESRKSLLSPSQRIKLEEDALSLCVCTFSKALNDTPDHTERAFAIALEESANECKKDDGWF
ncbi:hypothetical protein ACTU44_10315 [Thalassospira sp. SM2505]